MSEECIELKNIKYKTMLLNGNPIKETKSSNNMNHLDQFLENEMNTNKSEPWSKLDKTIKTKKLIIFGQYNDALIDGEQLFHELCVIQS